MRVEGLGFKMTVCLKLLLIHTRGQHQTLEPGEEVGWEAPADLVQAQIDFRQAGGVPKHIGRQAPADRVVKEREVL